MTTTNFREDLRENSKYLRKIGGILFWLYAAKFPLTTLTTHRQHFSIPWQQVLLLGKPEREGRSHFNPGHTGSVVFYWETSRTSLPPGFATF